MRTLFLSACSNPLTPWGHEVVPELVAAAAAEGFLVDADAALAIPHREHRTDPVARAAVFTHGFARDDVDAVIDITGGALALEMMPYVDWDVVRANPKPYVGLSDLTTVIGGIAMETGRSSLYWKPRAGIEIGFGLIRDLLDHPTRPIRPPETPPALAALPWVGGNLSTLERLIGTPWWPVFEPGSVVFLEGLSTTVAGFAAGVEQLRYAHVFDGAAAIALGQFTAIDAAGDREWLEPIMAEKFPGVEVVHIPSVGHSSDSLGVTLWG